MNRAEIKRASIVNASNTEGATWNYSLGWKLTDLLLGRNRIETNASKTVPNDTLDQFSTPWRPEFFPNGSQQLTPAAVDQLTVEMLNN